VNTDKNKIPNVIQRAVVISKFSFTRSFIKYKPVSAGERVMFLGTTHAVLTVCGSVTQSGPIYLKSDLLEIGLKSDQTYRVLQSSCRHRHSDVKGNAKTLLFSWHFISCQLMLMCHSLSLLLQLPLQQLPRKQHCRTVSTLLHKISL